MQVFILLMLIITPFCLCQTWNYTTTEASIVAGVGSNPKLLGVAALTQATIGGQVAFYNNADASWSKTVTGDVGMVLDSAISQSGISVSSGQFQVLISSDSGQSFESIKGYKGTGQSANSFGENSFALVGGWVSVKSETVVNGVLYSLDGGLNWDVTDIGISNLFNARYGSFPSSSTWYISTGMWTDPTPLDDDFYTTGDIRSVGTCRWTPRNKDPYC